MTDTRSLIVCPPNVLIRWIASWMAKTTRMRDGMMGVRTLQYVGLLVFWCMR